MAMKVKPSNRSNSLPVLPQFASPHLKIFFNSFIILVTIITFLATIKNLWGAKSLQTNRNMSTCHDIRYRLVSPDSDVSVKRYAAFCGDIPLSIKAWTIAMASDRTFSQDVTQIICDSPYKAVFFETKGCSAQNWDRKQFEFVLVDAPSLQSFAESSPDPQAFAEHLSVCRSYGCAFPNLGGDAQLIAPKARTPLDGNDPIPYSHLAAFCRHAPDDQVAHVWQLAAQEYQQRISSTSETVWFSTSGNGIAWLHFRLDRRPKYYTYKPFRNET